MNEAEILRNFENGLNPRWPERSTLPAKVLGYGEMSTVLEVLPGMACKRMPMFHSESEAAAYEDLYHEYIALLENSIGLRLPPGKVVRLADPSWSQVVVYILQEKITPEAVGNRLLARLTPQETSRFVTIVLREIKKVFDFNQAQAGRIEVAIDGQISNWAVAGWDPGVGPLPEEIRLIYFDTSTPLLHRQGVEQQNPELFLRSAPSFMRWIIRWLFLQDVITRYYDLHKVAVDIVANFYKEQRPELIPGLIETVNRFFAAETAAGRFQPLTEAEVRSYYREDALTWQVYLAFRKLDRTLHRLIGKNYPYILPGKIKR
jgi:hypothetical protein